MSGEMIIAACHAPVYNTPESEIITDHEVLLTRATHAVLDKLVEILRYQDDEYGLVETHLDSDQVELLNEDHDDDVDIATLRRALALIVLRDALDEVFPAAGRDGKRELSSEVSWLTVGIGDQMRTLLMTGGMTDGDEPTDVMPTVNLLADLELFKEPFMHPDAPKAAPANTLDSDELYALNDQLTAQLSALGWTAESEEDFDALNDLAHAIAPMQVRVKGMIDEFMANNVMDCTSSCASVTR